ncbi:MAG TPA: hypothetical protein VIO58_08180 [Candidatus Methanoperedens sp.]
MKKILLPIFTILIIAMHIALAEQNVTEKGIVVNNTIITKEGITAPGVNITKEGIEAPGVNITKEGITVPGVNITKGRIEAPGVVIAPGMIIAPGVKITENATPPVEINRSEIRVSESQIIIETNQNSYSATSIEVNVNGKNISINKEGDKIHIKEGNAEVETNETINVQTGNFSVLTDNGSIVISITPEELTAKKELINQTIQKIELKSEENKVLYHVDGIKPARLLFLIPVSINIQTDIDAASGNVETIKSPWWRALTS